MADNLAAQITTAPDLDIDQTNSRKAIITSPQPVLETADIPFPTNPNGPAPEPEEDTTDE